VREMAKNDLQGTLDLLVLTSCSRAKAIAGSG